MKETNFCRRSSTVSARLAARLRMVLSLLSCLMLLAGCKHDGPPLVQESRCSIPSSLTVCKAPPQFQPVQSQADVAAAMLLLDAAWEDCSKKLSRIPGVIAASCSQ